MAEQRQAAQIPNLLSLRGSRGGRGRGRVRGGFQSSSKPENSTISKDKIVQQTDQDASDSRVSAVSLGYLTDTFASAFSNPSSAPRRYPIINRGTYMRTTAIDILVNKFLATDPTSPKQIISLGAGSDTRYFRLISANPSLNLLYHEFDFPSNTSSKIRTIKASPLLLKTLTCHPSMEDGDALQISSDNTTLLSPTYNIHALDLRDLVNADSLPDLPNLSPTTPTLLLSECCLIYLPPSTSTQILQTLTNAIMSPSTPLSLILYEPILPHDAFGRTMVANLAQRGIELSSLHTYPTLSSQRARLKDAGFVDGQGAADVDFIFGKWITQDERDRVGQCEMLDEVEEWRLLARHYCVGWGWRNGSGKTSSNVYAEAWEHVQGQQSAERG